MDRRDMMAGSPPDTEGFDERSMTWTLEVPFEELTCANGEASVSCDCSICLEVDGTESISVPATFGVCETCHGKGKHVNPSIDAHGISREEFDEDPDFEQMYFEGLYDVPCYECHGRRVVPVFDETHLDEMQRQAVEWHRSCARANHEYDRMFLP